MTGFLVISCPHNLDLLSHLNLQGSAWFCGTVFYKNRVDVVLLQIMDDVNFVMVEEEVQGRVVTERS